MARREPRVHTINILKYLTWPKSSHFGLRTNRREREKKKRKPRFSLQFTGFHLSELDNLRVKVYLRDEGYAWVSESQDSTKVQGSGFHKNREKALSQETMPFEVGFFSYSG